MDDTVTSRNGILGRLCLSGHLNPMTPSELDLTLWHGAPGPSASTLPTTRSRIAPHFPTDLGDRTCICQDSSPTVTVDTPETAARSCAWKDD